MLRTEAMRRAVSRNQGGMEKSRRTSDSAAAYGTAAAVIDAMIVRNPVAVGPLGPPFLKNDQNVSPSIYASGPVQSRMSSRATVVFPAAIGPDNRRMRLDTLKLEVWFRPDKSAAPGAWPQDTRELSKSAIRSPYVLKRSTTVVRSLPYRR